MTVDIFSLQPGMFNLGPGGQDPSRPPGESGELGAHSPDRLGRVPRPKLGETSTVPDPGPRQHASPAHTELRSLRHGTSGGSPRPWARRCWRWLIVRIAGGSDSWTNLSAWSRVDVYGAAFGEVWAELDGLALPSRCVTVLGARRPGGHGFPPGRRLADRRMGERGCCLGRPVVASSRGAVSAARSSCERRRTGPLCVSCGAAVVCEDHGRAARSGRRSPSSREY